MRAETEVRWRAYWEAREAGYPDGETYDRYVHPDFRVPLEQVIREHPRCAPGCRLSAEVTDPHPCKRRPKES